MNRHFTRAARPCCAFHTASREPRRHPGLRTGQCASRFGTLATVTTVSAVLLGGCVAAYPPATHTVLSQLPEQPRNAPATLTPAEKQRYDEIGRQVLREQDAAMQAEALDRAWSRYPYTVAPVGGYYNGRWGYYGRGMGSGWSYPGYDMGWW